MIEYLEKELVREEIAVHRGADSLRAETGQNQAHQYLRYVARWAISEQTLYRCKKKI
jgi:hypothetical protein